LRRRRRWRHRGGGGGVGGIAAAAAAALAALRGVLGSIATAAARALSVCWTHRVDRLGRGLRVCVRVSERSLSHLHNFGQKESQFRPKRSTLSIFTPRSPFGSGKKRLNVNIFVLPRRGRNGHSAKKNHSFGQKEAQFRPNGQKESQFRPKRCTNGQKKV
jgi:hypothetical protein